MLLIDEPKPAPQIDFYSAPTFRVLVVCATPRSRAARVEREWDGRI